MKQAVVKDGDGKYSSAVNYYCQALEYFVPALDCNKTLTIDLNHNCSLSVDEEDYRTRESLKDMV